MLSFVLIFHSETPFWGRCAYHLLPSPLPHLPTPWHKHFIKQLLVTFFMEWFKCYRVHVDCIYCYKGFHGKQNETRRQRNHRSLTPSGFWRFNFRGCRPEASCQPASETPRCWAWRPSVYTTPGDQSSQRSVLRTEQQLQGRGLWSSQDLQGGNNGRFTYCDEYIHMTSEFRVGCLPLGIRRDDQTSCAPQSGVRGGQLMTG